MDFFMLVLGFFSVLLYLFIPGFALGLALFPRKTDIGFVERLGVSAFLGVVVPFLQYFFDKNFYVPINYENTLVFLVGVTLFGLFVWFVRVRFNVLGGVPGSS